jgi:hypothetical protein
LRGRGTELAPLCAICDSTNNTMRLCAKCRRSKYNKGWREGEENSYEEIEELAAHHPRHADMIGRRVREPSEIEKRALVLSTERMVIVHRHRWVRRNGARVREDYQRSEPLTVREIAFLVGCHPTQVQRAITRLSRSCTRKPPKQYDSTRALARRRDQSR